MNLRTGTLLLALAAIPAAAQTAPLLTALNPTEGTQGVAINLRVLGTAFLAGDTIEFTPPNASGSTRLSTIFVSSTELRASIPAALMTPAGAAAVRVFYTRDDRLCANGCRTTALPFQIRALFRLSTLNPDRALVGSTVNLAASGSGFEPDAYLVWRRGGEDIPLNTRVVSPSELQTTLPPSLLTPAGSAQVFVVNGVRCSPCPQSNILFFRIVTNLSLTSITPNRAGTRPATGPTEEVVLTGVDFARDARILWRAGPVVAQIPSVFVSRTEIRAAIPANLLTTPGTAFVSVRNPGPLGEADETSNELLFTIEQGLSITRLDPASVTAGSPDTILNVFGAGLSDSIRVQLLASGGQPIVPAIQIYNPAQGRIEVTLPATLLGAPVTYSVTAIDPALRGRVSNSLPFEVTPGARITSLTPNSRVAGSGAFLLAIAGSGFSAGSRVLFGTRELIPSGILTDRIDVDIPADAIANPGAIPVRVRSSAGLLTNSLDFTVTARALITSLDPSSRIAGSGAFTLNVIGSGFTPGSRVLFGTRELFPSNIAADRISVPVPADAIATAGIVPVRVRASDATETNSVDFTIAARALISSIDPATRRAGSGTFPLTILGSGFASGSRVVFGTREFIPSALTLDRIGVTIPADAILTPGIIPVKVRASDGSETNTVDFTVTSAATITSLNPASRAAGSGAFTLTVDGSGFVPNSAILFGTTRLIPSSINDRQILVTVPAAAIATAGRIPVRVTSTAGDSNEVTFEVTPPSAVTLTSLNPSSRSAGSGDFNLTLSGQNMLPNPRVTFAGTAVSLVGLPTATTTIVRIPAALIRDPGAKTVDITVGTTSATSTFNVTAVVPPAALSSASLRVTPGGNTTAEVTLSSPALSPIAGRLQLTFEPNASGTAPGFADPALMFVGSGGATLDFTIAAGQTRATLAESGRINVGTVAGTVVLTLTSLTSAGQPAASLPAPVRIEVPRAAPSLTAGSVRLTNSAGGVTVEVQGYSPGREVTSATIAFTIAAQTDVDGSTSFNVPLQTVFQTYFNSAAGRANGSRFQLRIPFTVDGDANRITGVSVTLINPEGQASLTGGR